MIIISSMVDHRSSNEDFITWDVKETLDKNNSSVEEQIPSMISDLAFKISHEMGIRWANSNEDYPLTWQAFKYLTQARKAYHGFIFTRNASYLDTARDMTVLAMRSDPSHNGSFEIFSNLGFAYVGIGKYDEAMDIFQNITHIKPFESALGIGLIYAHEERFAEALIAFDEAIDLNPNSERSWSNKGAVLYKLGKYDEAIKAYDKAIEIDPKYANAWDGKGNALDDLGKHTEAIKAYDKAIAINRQFTRAWFDKGIALNRQNKSDEAIKAYDRAISLSPRDAYSWDGKGSALDDPGHAHRGHQSL